MSGDEILNFISQLEGPYKWYVLGFILVVLTAIMTKVIFKTFKWFLILAGLAILIIVAVYYLAPDSWLQSIGVI